MVNLRPASSASVSLLDSSGSGFWRLRLNTLPLNNGADARRIRGMTPRCRVFGSAKRSKGLFAKTDCRAIEKFRWTSPTRADPKFKSTPWPGAV